MQGESNHGLTYQFAGALLLWLQSNLLGLAGLILMVWGWRYTREANRLKAQELDLRERELAFKVATQPKAIAP